MRHAQKLGMFWACQAKITYASWLAMTTFVEDKCFI